MKYCFLCGSVIDSQKPAIRRRVKTGDWTRTSYKKPLIRAVQTHFGMRIVCTRCSRWLDQRDVFQDIVRNALPLLALALLIGLLLFTRGG